MSRRKHQMVKKNNDERIGFTKDQMIQMLRILEKNNNLVLAIEEAHHENNVDYMKLEQELHFQKWKTNYVLRRLRWVAKQYDLPNIVVTEEELEEQIRKKEH
jgi:hypothetical protein